MFNNVQVGSDSTVEELKTTLWHCDKCRSFVSIHTTYAIDYPVCPSCVGEVLSYRGEFANILGTFGPDV